ncbi:hypothetical protein QE250_16790 [Chromatiaceae bacterium AAb-1]|nr:hypothetical protein [Chromatiaceae bacterium AAb-1]
MNGQDFLRVTHDAFEPFLVALGFTIETPSISGRFYRASFSSSKNTVSVSYEPGDNALFVLVFSRGEYGLSDIDDKMKTPRLADLNSRYMHLVSNEERVLNELFFQSVVVKDQEERLLLKCAKELRLVLPRYLNALSRSYPFAWLG